MRIDFHHHIFPGPFVEALAKWEGYPKAHTDSEGRLVLVRKQDSVTLPRAVYDVEQRLSDMNRYGIDIGVLSLPNPFIDIFPTEKAVPLARAVNESIAEAVDAHPDRLVGFGSLPMNSASDAIEEAKRAYSELGLRGFCLPTSVNGHPPVSEEHLEVYGAIASLGATVFFHPNNPAGSPAMSSRRLVTLVGYTFDTTLLVASLLFEGAFERFPNLKIVTAHLGGSIPYVAGRLERGFLDFSECKEKLSRPPKESLRRLYADTIGFDRDAMQLALGFFGEERLLYGTDYPFLLGTPRSIADDVKAMKISEDVEEKIFHLNAARLLGL